ncbi:MAG: hypothetical protein CMG54_01065 [Candidatus Marinimicrobia bacterium]|nr:hypothetical protein [Candidatus Neomarinimicrobiota bacterium]
MEIHLIWAQENNGGIGKNGQLPWYNPEDLKNFKKLTLNSTIVMGRKTWESLPFKPLPKRRNIVFSSKILEDVETYNNINQFMKKLDTESIKKIFIIGGSSIYKVFYEFATHLHMTIVNDTTDGIDTFFPINNIEIKNKFLKIDEIKLNEKSIYTYWEKK